MKISHITEATYENVSIIKDIIDFIIYHMPNSIPENSTYSFGYFARGGDSGNDWLLTSDNSKIPSIKELIEENKDNPKIKFALEALLWTTITFHNTEKYLNYKHYGEYRHTPIHIFVSRIQESTREFIVKYDSDTNTYPSMYNQRVFRTLFHELRHFFQDHTYPNYLRSKDSYIDKKTGKEREWGTRQVEWDAKWSDIIYSYEPAENSNINHYIEDVMIEFLAWVNISDKIKDHYKKKTAAYYINFYRKQVESVWNKTLKSMEPNILKGYYDRNETVELVLDELTWYYSGKSGEIPNAIKNYYKIKTIKYFEKLTVPLKQKKKLDSEISKYYDEWSKYVNDFVYSNSARIKDVNTYAASSAIVNRLMDNHPDFFYSKNKSIYELSHSVNKHYYSKTVELIKSVKQTGA